jgi:hypothetical protein
MKNMTMKKSRLSIGVLFVALLINSNIYSNAFAQHPSHQTARAFSGLHEVNAVARPDANHVVAIVGANLIDGRGGAPVLDAVVVIRGERIVTAGKRGR